MRNSFIDELVELARVNSKIALMVGDLGFSVVEPFQAEFPDRFFNAGVAEQNMMGVAAGLASEGYHVFVYSIANFPTFRCAEQIRNDVAYHNLPVTIVSVGGGLAYGNLGYSHHAVQDYALLRCMPNMLIAAPGDPFEVRGCLRYLVDNPQPSYLRLGKTGEIILHDAIPEVMPGEWLAINRVKNLKSEGILATGNGLQIASKFILEKNLNVDLFSLPLWGMAQKSKQKEQIEKFSKITVVEDHLIDGGFGSWILESLISDSKLLQRIKIEALNPSLCGVVASQEGLHQLNKYFQDN